MITVFRIMARSVWLNRHIVDTFCPVTEAELIGKPAAQIIKNPDLRIVNLRRIVSLSQINDIELFLSVSFNKPLGNFQILEDVFDNELRDPVAVGLRHSENDRNSH